MSLDGLSCQHARMHLLLNFFVPIKQSEVEPVLYSFSALFTILTSYFLLLPLREDAGISLGTSTLPLLFACSLLVTLIVTPAVTAYINSKGHAQGRDAALRHFYRLMALILLGFFVLYNLSLVEGWIDRVNLAQQHMHSSHLAHPLDTLLHHRRQQPAQQQQPGSAAAHPAALAGQSQQLQAASPQRPPHQQEQQQEQQWATRRLRHLLAADGDVNQNALHKPGSAADAASSPNSSTSSSSSSSSLNNGAVNGRTGDASLTKNQRRLRASFYVWVNVMNLVGISSLWAKCADAFSPEAGARLFGFISAGATLGQLAGSLIAMLASWVAGAMLTRVQASAGSPTSTPSSTKPAAPASSLLLVAAILQLVSAQFVTRIRPVSAAPAAALPAAKGLCGSDGDSSSSSRLSSDRQVVSTVIRRSTSGGRAAAGTHSSNGSASGTAAAQQGQAAKAWYAAVAAAAEGGGRGVRSDQEAALAAFPHPEGSTVAAANGCRTARSGIQACEAGAAGCTGSITPPPTVNGASGAGNGSCSGEQKDSKGPATGFHLHKVLTGFHLIWRSPYLLLVCSNLLLTYVVGSLMYFQRALVVSAAAATHGPTFRTAFFAALNTWSAAAILLMQLFATSSLLRRMGMSAALALAPVICLAGLLSISSHPLPWMVGVSEIIRKVFGYAVLRPAREVLFTVVSREEKYSAKLVIDTVIQRLGDALAAAVFQVLDVRYNLGQAGVGAAGCVMCFVWLATALALGKTHKQLASSEAALRV